MSENQRINNNSSNENNLEKNSISNNKERIIITKPKKRISVIIAASAIFSAISLGLSQLAPILPRVQWGLALFDPVSIVWILAFLIFGFETGILTSIIGMFLLMPFDSFAPIGPIMKFTATVPLIIIPCIILKIRYKTIQSKNALKFKTNLFCWILSVIARDVIMTIFNIIIISLMFGGDAFAAIINLKFLGLPSITGWTAVIITVIFINSLQSIWDYWIPYSIIQLFQRFKSISW